MSLPGRCVFRYKCELNCQVIVQKGESLLTSSCLACGDLAALQEQNVPQNVNKMCQNVGDSPSFWTKTWQFSSRLSRKTHLSSDAFFLWTHAWLWLVTSSLPDSNSFGTAKNFVREEEFCHGWNVFMAESKLSWIEWKLSLVERTLSWMEGKLSRVERKLSRVERKLSRVERKLPWVDRKFSRVERKLSRVERKLSRVERKLSWYLWATELRNPTPNYGSWTRRHCNVICSFYVSRLNISGALSWMRWFLFYGQLDVFKVF